MIEESVKSVVILDPNGRINWDSPAVIQRHDKYAQALSDQSNGRRRLLILTQKSHDRTFLTTNVEIINILRKKWSFFINIYRLISWSFTFTPKPTLLIASDPWNSFIHVKALSWALKLQGHPVDIQTQIHFEPNSIATKNLVDRKIRMFFLNKALKDSNSIRCVTKPQASQITKISPTSGDKILIAPVPLNLENNQSLCFTTNRPRVIGFLGRIHPERGLEKFLMIARELSHKDESIKYLIAGTGPNEKDFLANLRIIAGEHNVCHLGEINSESVTKFWSHVGILLSTAEFESYGRSVRESLYYGVPAVAFQSAGTLDLEEQRYPYFKAIPRNESSEEILMIIERLFSVVTDDDFKIRYEEEMGAGMSQLVENWIRHS